MQRWNEALPCSRQWTSIGQLQSPSPFPRTSQHLEDQIRGSAQGESGPLPQEGTSIMGTRSIADSMSIIRGAMGKYSKLKEFLACLPKSQWPLTTHQPFWWKNLDCSVFAPNVVTASQTMELFLPSFPQWLWKNQRAVRSYICYHSPKALSTLTPNKGTAVMFVVCAVLYSLSW